MKRLYLSLIAALFFAACPPERTYLMSVHFIDVGHGDCIFIQTPDDQIANNGEHEGYKILIDAGKDGRGIQYVIPYLNRLGLTAGDTIDYVIATHAHEDHIGGLPEIYDYFQVNNTLDPGYRYTTNAYNEYFNKATNEPNSNFYHNLVASGLITGNGDYINLGRELRVRILYSNPDASHGTNNTSIVVQMKYQDVSFLFMGDAEGKERSDLPSVTKDVERYLADTYGAGLKSTVLKVGHHGSETTSTDRFIQTVQPKYVVICAGCGVFSGTVLPDASLVQRYENAGAIVSRTDKDDIGKSEAQAGGDDHIVMETEGREITFK